MTETEWRKYANDVRRVQDWASRTHKARFSARVVARLESKQEEPEDELK